jgi:hypothetical protein
MVGQLSARDPAAARTRSLETLCATMRARLALADQDHAGARTHAARALAAARRERSEDRTADRYSVAAAYRLVGDVHEKSGDISAAKASWSAGLAQIPANLRERPYEMSERADLLRRVDRSNEARPLLSRLQAMGYRSNS